jgi:hypothetical protein
VQAQVAAVRRTLEQGADKGKGSRVRAAVVGVVAARGYREGVHQSRCNSRGKGAEEEEGQVEAEEVVGEVVEEADVAKVVVGEHHLGEDVGEVGIQAGAGQAGGEGEGEGEAENSR